MQTIIFDKILSLVIAQGEGPGGGGGWQSILIIILLFGGMWFLLLAPQRKKQKEHNKMLAELKTGDQILTSGGIYGEITNVKADRFVVKIADNTKIEVNKSAVQDKVVVKS